MHSKLAESELKVFFREFGNIRTCPLENDGFFPKLYWLGAGKICVLNLLNNFAWVSTNFWNTFSRPGRLVVVFTICKVSNIYHSRSLTINCWTSWRRWKNRWFVYGNNGLWAAYSPPGWPERSRPNTRNKSAVTIRGYSYFIHFAYHLRLRFLFIKSKREQCK